MTEYITCHDEHPLKIKHVIRWSRKLNIFTSLAILEYLCTEICAQNTKYNILKCI